MSYDDRLLKAIDGIPHRAKALAFAPVPAGLTIELPRCSVTAYPASRGGFVLAVFGYDVRPNGICTEVGSVLGFDFYDRKVKLSLTLRPEWAEDADRISWERPDVDLFLLVPAYLVTQQFCERFGVGTWTA